MITEIAENIYWTGVVDWSLRRFHGHELSTHRGSTYNAYLIVDEKTVLVDSVWGPFRDEFLESIREIVNPAEIDYVVASHAEADHAGALPELMRYAVNAEVIMSKRGEESFKGNYHHSWPVRTVGTGDTINIGDNSLVFIEAPMLHWPDSLFTYVAGAGILMPNDAFGQHYASAYRFNDQVNQKELFEEALKYYANILTPYSTQVTKKIDELLAMEVPVNMIAPSHGIIWSDDPLQIVKKYKEWAAQKPEPRATIIYDTMWEATRKMAEAIGEGLGDEGVDYKIVHAATTDRNDTLVEVFRSRMLVIGSPTLNYGVLPTITPLLEDLRGLRFKNKAGAAFGSYGWSGESVNLIEQHFGKCNIPVVREGIRVKWQPSPRDLETCRAFGRELAEETLKTP